MLVKPSDRALFKNQNYMLLWLGQAISQFGDAISFVAIPLLVFQLSGSPINLTLSFVIETVPWIVLGPIAGVFIDRWNKRTVMMAMDLIRCVIVGCIFFTENVYLLYALGFLIQSAAAIFAPARSSFIPQLVKKEHYVKAIALSHVAFQTVQVMGPIVAAAVIGWLGLRMAFIVDSMTFLLALLFCVMIKHVETSANDTVRRPFLTSLKEGISYIGKSVVLRHVTYINLLKAVIQSFIMIGTLLYMKELFHVKGARSDQLYSLMIGIMAFGTILGTWLIGVKEAVIHRRFLILGGLSLQGICLLLIAAAPNVYVLGSLFFVSGFALSGATSPVSAFYAEHTNDHIRGRVYSVTNATLQMASIIAFIVAGAIANYSSGTLLFTVAGLLLLLCTPLLILATRSSLSTVTTNVILRPQDAMEKVEK
ncbi:putative MFS family transporter protein [Fictibacillus macauensis ZFHKF-1]|uniref:Putative MFS family transporter protein n=1 Tax=Fictibacillus macauensis ZFHKF-1 TaxID=1196324 RepID=I8AFU0_9BACL|nr:MFS transporter [Fictibacillus macauensis]EIT84472.1 putative MFS family transporter protein [Fictibacillus macauensis ZFHKF-1]